MRENKVKAADVHEFIETYLWLAEQDVLKCNYDGRNGWLEVQYRNVRDAEGKNWKWSLVCAQDVNDYLTGNGELDAPRLVQRITLMLADKLRSVQQDCNILMSEGT
jgi:hypothetical protein